MKRHAPAVNVRRVKIVPKTQAVAVNKCSVQFRFSHQAMRIFGFKIYAPHKV